MNSTHKQSRQAHTGVWGLLFLPVPQLALITVVILLLILMVAACTKFTRGPVNTSALLQHLQRLQEKFTAGKLINPKTEREEMETLQNKIKTTSIPALISGNLNLKKLLYSNCKAIQAVLSQPDLPNRTAWIQLNALMVDFDSLYFSR